MIAALMMAAAVPVGTLLYLGPKVEEQEFRTAFDAAIVICGLVPESVEREFSWVTLEPQTAEEQASLEQHVKELAVSSGFQGPEPDHRATYEFIRSLLKTRTFLRYTQKGSSQEGQCVEDWLVDQGFDPLPADQPLPPELSA